MKHCALRIRTVGSATSDTVYESTPERPSAGPHRRQPLCSPRMNRCGRVRRSQHHPDRTSRIRSWNEVIDASSKAVVLSLQGCGGIAHSRPLTPANALLLTTVESRGGGTGKSSPRGRTIVPCGRPTRRATVRRCGSLKADDPVHRWRTPCGETLQVFRGCGSRLRVA